MRNENELCPCGQPLHYTDPHVEEIMRALVAELGPEIPVQVDDRTWLVPRHYIALHGLRAQELPALGFREMPLCNK